MRDCLNMGGARIGPVASLEPVRQRVFHESSFRVVVRKDFGSSGYDRRSLLVEHGRDLGMQLVSLTPEKRGVGGIANQGMLEPIVSIGGVPMPDEQFGLYEPV